MNKKHSSTLLKAIEREMYKKNDNTFLNIYTINGLHFLHHDFTKELQATAAAAVARGKQLGGKVEILANNDMKSVAWAHFTANNKSKYIKSKYTGYYSIDLVGVLPAYQGLGLCSAMLKGLLSAFATIRRAHSVRINLSSSNPRSACYCYARAAQAVGYLVGIDRDEASSLGIKEEKGTFSWATFNDAPRTRAERNYDADDQKLIVTPKKMCVELPRLVRKAAKRNTSIVTLYLRYRGAAGGKTFAAGKFSGGGGHPTGPTFIARQLRFFEYLQGGHKNVLLRRAYNFIYCNKPLGAAKIRGGSGGAPTDEELKATLHDIIEGHLEKYNYSFTTQGLTDALSRRFGGIDMARRRALIDQETARYVEERNSGGPPDLRARVRNMSWQDVAVRRRALEYAAMFAPWPDARRHIGSVGGGKTALAHGAEFDFVWHFVALDLDNVVCVGFEDSSWTYSLHKDYPTDTSLWERYFGPSASKLGLTSRLMALDKRKFFANHDRIATTKIPTKEQTRYLRIARYKAGLMCALASALSSGVMQYTLTYDRRNTRAYRLEIKFLYRGRPRILVKYFQSAFGTRPVEIDQGIDCFITTGAPGLGAPNAWAGDGRLQVDGLVELLQKRPGRKSVFCSNKCSSEEQRALQLHGVTERITAHDLTSLGIFGPLTGGRMMAARILLNPRMFEAFQQEWYTIWKEGSLPANEVVLDEAAKMRIVGQNGGRLNLLTWAVKV